MAGTNVVVTEGAGGQYTVAEVASGGLPDLPVGTLHTVYGALASLNSGKHRDGVIVIGGVVSMGPADAFTEIGQMIQLCKIAAHLPHRMDPARCTHAPNAAPIACPGGLLTLRRLETDGLQLQGRPGGGGHTPAGARTYAWPRGRGFEKRAVVCVGNTQSSRKPPTTQEETVPSPALFSSTLTHPPGARLAPLSHSSSARSSSPPPPPPPHPHPPLLLLRSP